MRVGKTLHYKKHILSSSINQLDLLNSEEAGKIPLFSDTLLKQSLYPFYRMELNTLQANIGKMCNQTCAHCHVDAGPDRKEIMTKETMQDCLMALAEGNFSTLDITGGAPEMNPDFRYFVEEATKLGKRVIVRSNLTIIVSNKKYFDLPDFFKANKVEIISSLPCYTQKTTDSQRGEGVFDASIKALKMLNEVGYGKNDPDLKLHLVYNPTGAFLPGDQKNLEHQYKIKLSEQFNIHFNQLYTITNMPISRFLDHLLKNDQLESYMDLLWENYNPKAAAEVMCRNMISVGWQGNLYDCDFNQMLDIQLKTPGNIKDFNRQSILAQEIQLNQHCFGCTAGAGSSCKGAIAAY